MHRTACRGYLVLLFTLLLKYQFRLVDGGHTASIRLTPRLLYAICQQRHTFFQTSALQTPLKKNPGVALDDAAECMTFYRESDDDYGRIIYCGQTPGSEKERINAASSRILSYINKRLAEEAKEALEDPCDDNETFQVADDGGGKDGRAGVKDRKRLWIFKTASGGNKCEITLWPDFQDKGFEKKLNQVGLLVASWLPRMRVTQVLNPPVTKSYVHVTTDAGRCFAAEGRLGSGSQGLNVPLTSGYYNLVHEFLHTLGLSHEHQRADRDMYVTIDLDNVKPDNRDRNFKKNDPKEWTTHNIPYSYNSIMHYSAKAYAINKNKNTITTKGGEPIGQRTQVADTDIRLIKAMYKDCL